MESLSLKQQTVMMKVRTIESILHLIPADYYFAKIERQDELPESGKGK